MAVNPKFSVLLDVYGNILTEKERTMLDYYYNDDLSLREISDNENAERRERRDAGEQQLRENDTITRQGVRDAIKRAECMLIDMEQRLKLVARFKEVNKGLEEIMDCATQINAENRKTGLSREINDLTVRIKSIALSLSE